MRCGDFLLVCLKRVVGVLELVVVGVFVVSKQFVPPRKNDAPKN